MENTTKLVRVIYRDGTVIDTNVNGSLSDAEIYEYFKVGKVFNIGGKFNDDGDELDNLQAVYFAVVF